MRSLHHLSRKAEGIGPVKPWQPLPPQAEKGAKSIPIDIGRDKSDLLYTATVDI